MVKNLLANAGRRQNRCGSGRSPGEENGNSLQYSRPGNPMDRGACQATIQGGHKELDTTEPSHNKGFQRLKAAGDISAL